MKKTLNKIIGILLCVAFVVSLLVICRKPNVGVSSDNGISVYQDSIAHLTALNDSLNGALDSAKIVYKDRIKVIKVMTPEKQVETFSQNTEMFPTILKDSIAEIPITSIEKANEKFVELDYTKNETGILKQIITSKDKMIGCYSKEVDTLNVQGKTLKKSLSKQRLINKITLIGTGIVAIMAIIK